MLNESGFLDILDYLDKQSLYTEADVLDDVFVKLAKKSPRWEAIIPAIGMAGTLGYNALNPVDMDKNDALQTQQSPVTAPVYPAHPQTTNKKPILHQNKQHKKQNHYHKRPAQHADIKAFLNFLSGVEGGYDNRSVKHDPGGETNLGITHKEYDKWIRDQARKHHKKPPKHKSVKHITEKEKDQIVKEDYWNKVHADALPKYTALQLTNWKFNGGPCVHALQRIIGAPITGVVGPVTLQKVKEFTKNTDNGDRYLAKLLADAQIKYQRHLKIYKFNPGWENRYKDVVRVINNKNDLQ